MNTATLIPESPALLIDAPPKFNIVIIYEDADAGRRARRFSDTLLHETRDECHCVRNLCAEREHLAGSSRWHFNPARTAGAGAMAAQPGREHPGCVAGTPMGRFS